jgi:hypothetical protein
VAYTLFQVRSLILKEEHGSHVVENKAFTKTCGIRGWSKWVNEVITNYPEVICDDKSFRKKLYIFKASLEYEAKYIVNC